MHPVYCGHPAVLPLCALTARQAESRQKSSCLCNVPVLLQALQHHLDSLFFIYVLSDKSARGACMHNVLFSFWFLQNLLFACHAQGLRKGRMLSSRIKGGNEAMSKHFCTYLSTVLSTLPRNKGGTACGYRLLVRDTDEYWYKYWQL